MEYVRYCIKCGKPKIYKNLHNYTYSYGLMCRSCAKIHQNAKLYSNKIEKLLEDAPETYYWIGYLLADGHFKNNNRIMFSQNNEDKISVENFVKYIEGTSKIKYTNNDEGDKAKFWIQSNTIVPKITKKFDIKSNKTYSPPNTDIFENMDIDLLSYLFIGFVDGDGSISKGVNCNQLRITVHPSWFEILKIFEKRIFGLSGYTKIDEDTGYAVMIITRTDLLSKFKKQYFSNITFEPLHRKWDKIDIDFIKKGDKVFNKIKELYDFGYKPKEISEQLNYSISKVYWHIKKIKRKE